MNKKETQQFFKLKFKPVSCGVTPGQLLPSSNEFGCISGQRGQQTP